MKNNLQTISSLLRLQSNELADDKSKESFNDAINRVQSISMLHEVMYTSDNLLRVDLTNYIKSIAGSLIDSYELKKDIQFDIESDLERIQNDSIIPISLILNELISNSLKHAFENLSDCKIRVQIKKIEKNKYRLIYSDNGLWKENNTKTFGRELINTLTEQLNGDIEKKPNKTNSEYYIKFEVNMF